MFILCYWLLLQPLSISISLNFFPAKLTNTYVVRKAFFQAIIVIVFFAFARKAQIRQKSSNEAKKAAKNQINASAKRLSASIPMIFSILRKL